MGIKPPATSSNVITPGPAELGEARKLAGRTQAECGALLGMTRAAYGYRESGKAKLKPDEWHRLRSFFLSGPNPGGGVAGEMRRARLMHGYSNEMCGEAIGVSREGYRKREEGTVPITGPELALLARRLYDVSLQTVFPSYSPSEAERVFLQEMQCERIS